jgi:hypothetical protein
MMGAWFLSDLNVPHIALLLSLCFGFIPIVLALQLPVLRRMAAATMVTAMPFVTQLPYPTLVPAPPRSANETRIPPQPRSFQPTAYCADLK